jgi:quinol monooxygenase YgiN
MSLRVVAVLPAKPDRVDEVREILKSLIGPTRAESGCITYELLQNNADPAEFTFVEEWESDAALDAHLATAHIQTGLEKVTPLLAGPPDIRRYSLVA